MATISRINDTIEMCTNYQFDEIQNIFIPLKDGTQLSCRMWLPKGIVENGIIGTNINTKNKVPAVLEFLPYRKRDLTAVRDEITYPYLAHNGFAGIRVDMRGCGDSSGIVQDEYNESELSDAEEILEWIESQDWCTGNVGMQGISWGGFNSVQLAYRQPPALKAIISIAFTTDRYADDIHYKGGALMLSNIQWGNCIAIRNALPADPTISEDWREKWMERLADMPRASENWISHQTRDEYWKHGSVCEDFSRIKTPVFMVGGYNDGYTNSVPKLLNNIDCPKKALIGPWVHLYPHLANPSPVWQYLEDSVRWWNKWLKGIDNKQDEHPDLIAYICDMPKPDFGDTISGRFVSLENGFNNDTIKYKSFGFKKHHLTEQGNSTDDNSTDNNANTMSDEILSICSPEHTGSGCGQYFPFGPAEDFATDQKSDDAGSLVFDTDIFETDTDILGEPQLTIRLSADKPVANAYVRLSVVHPTGEVRRISYTPINMNRDDSHEHSTTLKLGEIKSFSIALDVIGEKIRKGARLRISVSSAYFPMFWANPEHTTISVHTAGSSLTIPILENAQEFISDFAPNEGGKPYAKTDITDGEYSRTLSHDLGTGIFTTTLVDKSGISKFDANGLTMELNNIDVMSIHPTNPNLAKIDSTFSYNWSRDDWKCSAVSNQILTSDKNNFYIQATLRVLEDDTEIFLDAYTSTIKRNGV